MFLEKKWYGKPLFVQVNNMVKQTETYVLCQNVIIPTRRMARIRRHYSQGKLLLILQYNFTM